ncbi:hypothetical protein D3C78_695840 [compost metagenome]
MGVDPGAAILQVAGHLAGQTQIPGPHRAGEAVVRIVGPLHHLFGIVEAGYRHNWAEHLPAHDFILLAGVGYQGRLEEEAVAGADLAACGHLHVAAALGPLHEAGDPVALAVRDERPHLHPLFTLAPHLDGGHGLRHGRDELVVDLALGIDAAGGGAVLSGVVEAEGANARHHGLQIRIVEDDDRCLTPQLQVGALHGAGGALQDLLAGGDVTGQRHHAHQRVLHQRRPHALAPAADDVDDAAREELAGELGEAQGGERGLLGGFEHHRIAGGEHGSHLPGRHHQGVVPGGYAAHHPYGVATDHAGVPLYVFPRQRSLQAAGRAGEEAEAVHHRRQLVIEHRQIGLAAVEGFERRKLLGVALDGIGQAQQQGAALGRGGAAPLGEGALGAVHRPVHLLERRLGHRGDQLPGGGIEDGLGLAVTGHELAVDQELGREFHGCILAHALSHYLPLPATSWPSRVR